MGGPAPTGVGDDVGELGAPGQPVDCLGSRSNYETGPAFDHASTTAAPDTDEAMTSTTTSQDEGQMSRRDNAAEENGPGVQPSAEQRPSQLGPSAGGLQVSSSTCS